MNTTVYYIIMGGLAFVSLGSAVFGIVCERKQKNKEISRNNLKRFYKDVNAQPPTTIF